VARKQSHTAEHYAGLYDLKPVRKRLPPAPRGRGILPKMDSIMERLGGTFFRLRYVKR